MLPILPLIIGAAAGAAATQLVRTKAVQQGLKKAGSQIRQAGDTLKQKASDGLDTVRETGAQMRRKVADTLHRRGTARTDDNAYEDASALLLPAPHDEATAPKKASRNASGARRRAARSPSTSQAGGASPKNTRRAATARDALEKASRETPDETPAPRRRPRNRPWPPTTKRTARTTATASMTPSSESRTDDDAGQH